MRTRLCLTALAIVAALATPGTALAHDHRPPEAIVVTDLGSRPATNYMTTWASGNARICTSMAADGYYAFDQPPVPWLPGTEIVVRLETRHKPTRVRPTAFLLGDPTTGTPIYGKTEVPYELRKAEVEGETMWEVVLSPLPSPDLYVDVYARWKDHDCGIKEAAWSFRAGLLPI